VQDLSKEPHFESRENDDVSVRFSRAPGCHVTLEVTVKPPLTAATYEKAVKNIKKEVSIPGFRKGKAPDAVIFKNFSTQIDREWKDLLTRSAFDKTIPLINMAPLSASSIKRVAVKKCVQGEAAEVHFEYEASPEIPTIDIAALATQAVAPRTITDEDVAFELKKQLVRHATFEELSDHPVQEGDFVEISVDIIENPAHNVFTNRLFEVTKDEMPEWVYNLVLGMNIGESREGLADFAATPGHVHTEECHHSPAKQCRVTVTAIKRASLPPADDEFAKKYGLASILEFRERIRAVLDRDSKSMAAELTRSNLANELLEKYPIDLPLSLLSNESKMRFHYCSEMLKKTKGALPEGGQEEERIRYETYLSAKNFLSLMYLTNQISKAHNFAVTEYELVQEINYESTQVPPEHRIIFPDMDPHDAKNRLFMRMMMRKALDWIMEQKQKG
jgi:trigger factor